MIALFAWAALTSLPQGRLGRAPSASLATLITVGLFAAERRADIVVAILGMATLLILGRPASHEGASKFILTATPTARSASAFALAPAVIGSAALISFLGTSKLVPFLTSASNGVNAIALIFSPVHSYVLTGQGTGTSTQGIGVLGVQSFITFVNNYPYESYVYGGRSFLSAEGGLTKTWLELGIVGVILYTGVFLSVLGPPLRSLRRLDGVGRALTMLTVALGIVFLKGHASLDDPLVQPLFWLAAGGIWGRIAVAGPVHRSLREGPQPEMLPSLLVIYQFRPFKVADGGSGTGRTGPGPRPGIATRAHRDYHPHEPGNSWRQRPSRNRERPRPRPSRPRAACRRHALVRFDQHGRDARPSLSVLLLRGALAGAQHPAGRLLPAGRHPAGSRHDRGQRTRPLVAALPTAFADNPDHRIHERGGRHSHCPLRHMLYAGPG